MDPKNFSLLGQRGQSKGGDINIIGPPPHPLTGYAKFRKYWLSFSGLQCLYNNLHASLFNQELALNICEISFRCCTGFYPGCHVHGHGCHGHGCHAASSHYHHLEHYHRALAHAYAHNAAHAAHHCC